MKSIQLIVVTGLLASSSLMCSIFGSGGNSPVTEAEQQATVISLQQTVDGLQQQAVTATIEPTKAIQFATQVKPPSGAISGALNYPAESLPALRVVAINVKTGEYFATEVIDSGTYGLDNLPVGQYHVLAYLINPDIADPGLIGGYTQFVLCGQTADCIDHSLAEVNVIAKSVTMNINPADWYAPPGTYPPDPTQ